MSSNKDFIFRFTVGEKDGAISSIWRLWFNKPEVNGASSDVYFAYRALGGVLKLSIHESGDIHFSFTGDYAKLQDIQNQQRHIEQWKLKFEDPIFKIIVPFTELRKTVIEENHIPIEYISAPLSGNALEIFLYITQQSLSNYEDEHFLLLLEKPLANKNILSLIRRDNPITEYNSKLYLTQKNKLKENIINHHINGKDLRGFLLINNQGKERGFIDLAL